MGQWRDDTGKESRRAQVHIVVEGETEPQQKAALDQAARETRVPWISADGAEQDGVVSLERVESRIAQDLARGEIVRGTEGEMGGREFDVGWHHRFEHFHCFADDLRPDSVTGDERESDSPGHGMTPGCERDGEWPSGAAITYAPRFPAYRQEIVV